MASFEAADAPSVALALEKRPRGKERETERRQRRRLEWRVEKRMGERAIKRALETGKLVAAILLIFPGQRIHPTACQRLCILPSRPETSAVLEDSSE